MTITAEERRRLVETPDESQIPQTRRAQGSRIAASLMGMLAALGTLVLTTAALAATALLLDIELGVITLEGDFRVLTVMGFILTGIVLGGSMVVGGYVAGRIAGNGGLVGIGVALWATLVVMVFALSTLWIGAVSDTFDGIELADRFTSIADGGVMSTAIIVIAGLFVVAIVGGVLGGRLVGSRTADMSEVVVDIRDGAEGRAAELGTRDPLAEHTTIRESPTG